MKWSPVVSLIGARQTGKTTLFRGLAGSEFSFDDPSAQRRIEQAGAGFLDTQPKPLFLDEVQKHPPIFDLLKYSVDRERRPGQFLITGSVRFSARREIRESLTGRTVVWELLPLTLSEAHEKPFKPLVRTLLGARTPKALAAKLESQAWAKEEMLADYGHRGGLPGICFLRDQEQRNLALDSYLDTLLSRDLMLVRSTGISPAVLRELLSAVISLGGSPVRFSPLARATGISVPTAKALIEAYEALFLLRRHGKTWFAEDPGVASFLAGPSLCKGRSGMLRLVFHELLAQVTYHRDEIAQLREHETRGGAHVPFVIRSQGGRSIGITIDDAPEMSEKSMQSLYSFLRKADDAVLLNLHRGKSATIHRERILSVPWTWIW